MKMLAVVSGHHPQPRYLFSTLHPGAESRQKTFLALSEK